METQYKCKKCGQPVQLVHTDEGDKLYDANGNLHICKK